MVKIQLKSLLISLIILIFIANAAYASDPHKLIITAIDAKVGSRTVHTITSGNTINEDARPGDNVEIRVDVKNNFTSAENLRIRDISVKGTIESIDNGNDLEQDSSNFNLGTGSSKRVTLRYQVPLQVDEDTFNIDINAEGEDQNGTTQTVDAVVKLNVNKRSHDIRFVRDALSPAEITCKRANIRLDLSFINLGNDDENTVNIQIYNPDLGLDIKDSVSNLLAQANDPASRFSKIYSFKVANDVPAGAYPIAVRLSYNNDNQKKEDTVYLTVSDCSTTIVPTKTTESTVPVQTNPPTTPSTSTTVVQQVPPNTTVTQEGGSFFGGNGFVIAIVLIEVVAVIVGIILLIALFGKR